MDVAVVYESLLGNTRLVAEAIANRNQAPRVLACGSGCTRGQARGQRFEPAYLAAVT